MSENESADLCLEHLEKISQRQVDQADCVLVCNDGSELICHSLFLSSASAVLGALEDTSPVDGKHRLPRGSGRRCEARQSASDVAVQKAPAGSCYGEGARGTSRTERAPRPAM